MIKLTEWLKDIRIGYFRISASGAQVIAWTEIASMSRDWYGNMPYKVMVF